jgi:hypothetical protein
MGAAWVVGSTPVGRWDRWGITASTLCALHCLLMPVAALAMPAIAAHEGATHVGLAVAVVLFALLAFVPGMRMHGKLRVVLLGLAGLALIWTTLLMENALGELLRDGLTLAGGLMMVAAHGLNVVLCRRCAICCRARSAGVHRVTP